VLRAAESNDPLVQEYLAYLEEVDAWYARGDAALDDPATASDALRRAHVQWRLLERIFDGVEGRLGNGANRDGSAWTQFAFRRVYLA
jgi:hypothetical protein